MTDISETELQIFQDYENDMKKLYDEIERKEQRALKRVFTVVEKLKGKEFLEELKDILEESEADGLFGFVRTTTGDYQEENYKLIKGMWVHQYRNGGFTGDDFAGYCYIEIKPNRYLKFHYSM